MDEWRDQKIMNDWIIRVLNIYRMLPDEVDRLEYLELNRGRCLTSFEIQTVLRKPTLTSYYNLQVSGMNGDEKTANRIKAIENSVKSILNPKNAQFLNLMTVEDIHGLDTEIENRRQELNGVLSEYIEARNLSKSRLQRIKDEKDLVTREERLPYVDQ